MSLTKEKLGKDQGLTYLDQDYFTKIKISSITQLKPKLYSMVKLFH